MRTFMLIETSAGLSVSSGIPMFSWAVKDINGLISPATPAQLTRNIIAQQWSEKEADFIISHLPLKRQDDCFSSLDKKKAVSLDFDYLEMTGVIFEGNTWYPDFSNKHSKAELENEIALLSDKVKDDRYQPQSEYTYTLLAACRDLLDQIEKDK